MKRLFIRFFENKEDQIPKDSMFLCNQNAGETNRLAAIADVASNVADWVERKPNGKVDYVWL